MSMLKPTAILAKLRLQMPLAVTIEDPLSRQPIAVSYDNLHSLLVLDSEHLVLEGQIIANLYAEMARLQRAAEFEAAKAEGRYRSWKVQMVEELGQNIPEKKTQAGKRASKQGPTTAEGESYYRAHADYARVSSEPPRWRAIAGFFDDLKWAFKIKSQMMTDQSKIIAGYESTVRAEGQTERLSHYENLAQEAQNIAAASGSSEAFAAMLAKAGTTPLEGPPKPKTPRSL
jgi:hypothetical protein